MCQRQPKLQSELVDEVELESLLPLLLLLVESELLLVELPLEAVLPPPEEPAPPEEA